MNDAVAVAEVLNFALGSSIGDLIHPGFVGVVPGPGLAERSRFPEVVARDAASNARLAPGANSDSSEAMGDATRPPKERCPANPCALTT
ncbi:MAG: hypothetical protein F4Y60_01095 [Boseongicola sp. SB0664_bin_43]|uniref:Uncharacterized protein n=1 Tax=Boseongicola sp. SB0664_bin_43 TaxID=2604844 RepID=A0A6B0XY08_9RHOB|nr:hypothetical protein [Boseongicola sp. SB0664_bin_43]